MVEAREKITVYQYMYWDEDSRSRKKSRLYAPLELIKSGLGTPIYTSVREVDRAALTDGIFIPPDC